MTVRELSRAQSRVMDLLADHPDWTNDELAHAAGYKASYVEQLLFGAYQVYRVGTRTGAVVAHLRRRGPAARKRRDPESESMGL